MVKLDDEWVLQGQPKGHNPNGLHQVFVACVSERFLTFECSCGINWSRPYLRIKSA